MNMGVSQERKCLLNIVSQKLISYDFLYFLCIAQSEEDLWRFQVEAHRAHACKQVLGLCHSPPRLENQSVFLRKIEKPHGGKKTNNYSLQKTCLAGKNGCYCATYIMVCAGKKRKLSMERET